MRKQAALVLLALLAGAGCRSGKWAWQLSDKERRLDHVKAKEAPVVQRPTPCMEALAGFINHLARNT
jgi:hypothetical protein